MISMLPKTIQNVTRNVTLFKKRLYLLTILHASLHTLSNCHAISPSSQIIHRCYITVRIKSVLLLHFWIRGLQL